MGWARVFVGLEIWLDWVGIWIWLGFGWLRFWVGLSWILCWNGDWLAELKIRLTQDWRFGLFGLGWRLG